MRERGKARGFWHKVWVGIGVGAFDHLVYGKSHEHQLRHEQHAELGNERVDNDQHFSRQFQLVVDERIDKRTPHGNDDLRADGQQFIRLVDSNGDGERKRRGHTGHTDHHNVFLPERNPRIGVCGMRDIRDGRHPALHVFSEHQRQQSSVARGNVSECEHGNGEQFAGGRPRDV